MTPPKYNLGDLVIARIDARIDILAGSWLEQHVILRAFYDFGRESWIYVLPNDNIAKEYEEKEIISVHRDGKWI